MRRRVVVTGLGCITPLGNDVETLWQNILAGKSGVGPITHYDTTDHKTKIAAQVKDFDASAQQAVEAATLPLSEDCLDRIGVVVGSGIGGMSTLYEQIKVFNDRGPSRVSPFLVSMMIPDTGGGIIAIRMGMRGPNFAVVTACATGTNAVGEAAEVIRRGQADAMLAGGSEAVIVPIAMASLNVMGALSTRNDDPERASRPFDLDRDGFVIGEGAAVLILEELVFARAHNAPILAEVLGYGSTNDAFHITAPSENGSGAARCMRMALDDAGLLPAEIDYINAHGTSTPLNDKSETAAIKTVFGEQAYEIPISSTKSMTGHMIGASGAVEALICTQTLQTGILPPTINYETPDPECDLDYVPNKARPWKVRRVMSNSFGFGGHNASIILGEYYEGDQAHESRPGKEIDP